MKGIVSSHIYDLKSLCLCDFSYNEEIQYERNGSHYDKLMESGKKHLVLHSAYVQCNVIAYHCIDHEKYHNNCENNFLKLVFGHKKTSYDKLLQENVLFVNHSENVRFQ